MTLMDQQEIIDALGKHLDSMSDTLKAVLIASIVFFWAGVSGADPVKALGADIPRKYVLFTACLYHIVINFKILTDLVRIGDLIKLIDEVNLSTALTKVVLHRLSYNPFAYFGQDIYSRLQSSYGYGAMIVIWWIGNASIYSLSGSVQQWSFLGLVLQCLFLGLGLASMIAIRRVYRLVLLKTRQSMPEFYKEIRRTIPERTISAFAGILMGVLIALIAQNISA